MFPITIWCWYFSRACVAFPISNEGSVSNWNKTSNIKYWVILAEVYCNVPKFSDRQIWANSADPDQGLYCLPFCLHLLDPLLYGKILGWLQKIFQLSKFLGFLRYFSCSEDLIPLLGAGGCGGANWKVQNSFWYKGPTRSNQSWLLTHISLASYFWDTGKQYRPRWDAAERGVSSGSTLFAYRNSIKNETSSPKGNDRSPESNVPMSNLI